MRHRCAVAAVLALFVTTAGCVGIGPGASTERPKSSESSPTPSERTDTSTTPPAPSGSIDFPEGPKEAPERPAALNGSSVREYVRSYEYRIAYNSLWVNENTTVTLACRVNDVTERSWGYGAVVTCTGSSETNGLNGDWFTQTYRYRVGEDALDRTQLEPREPVS